MYQHDLLRWATQEPSTREEKMLSSGLTGHVSGDPLYLQEILNHMCCLSPSFTRSL